MALNFDKYANEAKAYVHKLAKDLGHPEEIGRTEIILRAVLHSLRDRITINESLDLLAQLPMFLKAIYVDEWKSIEKPLRLKNIQEFTKHVEEEQAKYGETEFSWDKSTQEIVRIVLSSLTGKYLSEGEVGHLKDQLPESIAKLFEEQKVNA